MMVAPMRDESGVMGMLVVAGRTGASRRFQSDDLVRLQNLTEQLAVSLRKGMLHQRIEREARLDGLTGLPNRVSFEKSLESTVEPDKLTLTHGGETKIWSRAACGDGFSFKFAQATADTIGFHPSAYKLHDFLDGPPIPSLYAVCNHRVYAFLKLADGRLLALRDPHLQDLQITYLTR